MRKAAQTAHDAYDFDDDDGSAPSLRRPRRAFGGKQMRRILAGGALVVGAVIVVNALTLQDQRHAAPLFGKSTTVVVREEPAQESAPVAPLPAPRPVTVAQRTTDSTTTQAIAPSADPIGREIARIEQRPAPKAEPARVAAPVAKPVEKPQAKPAHVEPRPVKQADAKKEPKPAKADAIAGLLKSDPTKPAASDKSVLAAQRALQKLGYVVSPNGVFGPGTKQAVAQFERDHQIPVTGALSQKTMRELARLSSAL